MDFNFSFASVQQNSTAQDLNVTTPPKENSSAKSLVHLVVYLGMRSVLSLVGIVGNTATRHYQTAEDHLQRSYLDGIFVRIRFVGLQPASTHISHHVHQVSESWCPLLQESVHYQRGCLSVCHCSFLCQLYNLVC